MVVAWLPAVVPGGSVPKRSRTLSPSSSALSSSAVTVNVPEVEVAAKTTLLADSV